MALPGFFVEQLRRGRVVLFLGAGASWGCANKLGGSPPLGGDLARQLSERISIPFDPQDDLATVAANAKNILGDEQYWLFLRERYLHVQPSDSLKRISRYPWHRIYTTNIDDALEAAYTASKYSLDKYINSSPVFERPADLSVVQLIKLNGSIDRLEAGLIFTADEYRSESLSGRRWYDQVARDFLGFTFLFVGTNLNEPIFTFNVDRLRKEKGEKSGRSYIACPTFSANWMRQLVDSNIEPLELTIDDLVRELESSFGPELSASQVLKERSPAIQSLFQGSSSAQVTKIAGQFDNVEVVLADNIRMSVPAAKPGVRPFYYGAEPVWRDIVDGVPANLRSIEQLNDAVDSESRIVVVHGPAGSGKSTALMAAAYQLSDTHPEKLVVWVRRDANFPSDALRALGDVNVSEIVIFVDDFSRHAAELSALIDQTGTKLRFILAERTHLIPGSQSEYHIVPEREESMSSLAPKDVDNVLGKLEKFGPWGRLGRLSQSARRSALRVVAQKQLLVGLREATEGVGYDKIAASEFEKVDGEYARDAYVLIALASMHRHGMSRSTFDAAIRELISDSVELPPTRLSGLEEIALEENGSFRIRHQILADFTILRVVERELSLRAVEAVWTALARFESPIRTSAPKQETRLFAALTNHEFLWRLFRAEKLLVLDMFASHEMVFGSDALFWLQYALFEQKCGTRYLASAVNHIRTALRIYPDSYQVLNAYANIHFALALSASRGDEALALMESATQSIHDQVENQITEAYAAVALAKGRISVLNKFFPERVPAEVKEAEARLRDALLRAPGNKNIQGLLNELNLHAIRGTSRGGRRGR